MTDPLYADPSALAEAGRALWDDVVADNPDLDPMQRVQLLEACRMKDRLDRLDAILRGDAGEWMTVDVPDSGTEMTLNVDRALASATSTLNICKQVIAALRLPDRNGRPGRRARTPSGVYDKGGTVSALDRARSRRPS
jgi:hypothetical protein